MTDGGHSAERSTIHPITALPRAGKEGAECGKKERGGGMGDGDTEGQDVATRMSLELCVCVVWNMYQGTALPLCNMQRR